MDKSLMEKSKYCLNCKTKPCSQNGCPLNNDIPGFIAALKNEQYEEAYRVLCKTTVMPAICGRVCPHYKQCMGSCVRGIKGESVQIGDLEAFIGDIAIKNGYKIKKEKINCPKDIAVIGGGPAGLTAAAFLAIKGHHVTIYERYNYLGGLLIHGIPEFRLPKNIVENVINKIIELGIEIKLQQELGKNLFLEELEETYDSIILAFGANISSKMGIKGEDLQGVYGGNELLEHNTHPDYRGKTVIVNGGGNVAMDVSRTIKRLGAKRVIVIYRRAREQMPAEQKEIDDAISEGVEFLFQNNIIKIIGDNSVEAVEVVKTELVKKDDEIRPSPVNIPNSNYILNADYIVMAIGSHPADITKRLGLEIDEKGYIKVDKNGRTSNSKIYAIGDIAGNIATVAWAARSGRDIADKVT